MSENLKARTSHDLTGVTMAFIPKEKNGSWVTEALVENVTEPNIINTPAAKVIFEAHEYYGEKLIARFDGAKILCGFMNKSPVAISVINNYYFFPTHSPANPNCAWISNSHVSKISKGKYGDSIIHFKDGRELSLPVSDRILDNQRYRTSHYRVCIEEQLKSVRKQGKIDALLKIFDIDRSYFIDENESY